MELDRFINKAMKGMPSSKRHKALDIKVDRDCLIHMGLNENPYGMSPKSLAAMRDGMELARNYPDFSAMALRTAIADYYGMTPENILTGSGSSSMIDMVGQTFLDSGDEVLFCTPTFEAFPDMTYLNEAVPVTVPLTEDQRFDLDGMLRAVTDRTKIVVVCNPNNPTGTHVGFDAIKSFLLKLPNHVLAVLDEAYIEFATAPDCRSMVEFLKENPEFPILILKTFSKYYGMAGLRVGYALGPAELIASMRKCSAAWNLNVFAHKAAIAAIADQEFYHKTRAMVVEGREYIMRELEKLGCRVFDSQTNFIYFDSGRDSIEIQKAMFDRGIHIGAFQYSRVSVGTLEECHLFIEKMKEVLA